MERRAFIKNSTLTVFSISAFGALNWNGKNFEGNTPTTTDILGPFYRPGAPLRSNLRWPNSNGAPLVLKGYIFKGDGKTPVNNALVEIWHCDENELYDNTSDEYRYRGAQRTTANGKYAFETILPVPYKRYPNNPDSPYRAAHIHMRVSVPGQQDLITQIYFKGGKYNDTDYYASLPQAASRTLAITKNASGIDEIDFNVIMSKEIPLDKAVYQKITGVYDIGEGNYIEFIQSDDLLFMKRNGRFTSGLKYVGNNSFEDGPGLPKASFELQKNGAVKVVVVTPNTTYTGTKQFKYNE